MWKVTANCASRTPRAIGVFFFILAALVAAVSAPSVHAADGAGRLVPGDQITVTVKPGDSKVTTVVKIEARSRM